MSVRYSTTWCKRVEAAVLSLFSVSWCLKDGKEVSKGHTLTLNDATLDTAGTYVCMVTVPEIEGMETSGTLRVHVQGRSDPQALHTEVHFLCVVAAFQGCFSHSHFASAPPNVINPKNTEMEESSGNTVVLSCDVRGFPAPSVTWTTADGKVLQSYNVVASSTPGVRLL